MRFQAITKFLNDTEEYLNKLATKLTNIKNAEESMEHVQRVMEEARRCELLGCVPQGWGSGKERARAQRAEER